MNPSQNSNGQAAIYLKHDRGGEIQTEVDVTVRNRFALPDVGIRFNVFDIGESLAIQ
jgi:hypothetical protein